MKNTRLSYRYGRFQLLYAFIAYCFAFGFGFHVFLSSGHPLRSALEIIGCLFSLAVFIFCFDNAYVAWICPAIDEAFD